MHPMLSGKMGNNLKKYSHSSSQNVDHYYQHQNKVLNLKWPLKYQLELDIIIQDIQTMFLVHRVQIQPQVDLIKEIIAP